MIVKVVFILNSRYRLMIYFTALKFIKILCECCLCLRVMLRMYPWCLVWTAPSQRCRGGPAGSRRSTASRSQLPKGKRQNSIFWRTCPQTSTKVGVFSNAKESQETARKTTISQNVRKNQRGEVQCYINKNYWFKRCPIETVFLNHQNCSVAIIS